MADISSIASDYISVAVKLGIYPNADTALAEAVNLFQRRDQLRADVQHGIQQADRGDLLPAEEVFRRSEQRVTEIEAQAAHQK
jgi:hypothetical protein